MGTVPQYTKDAINKYNAKFDRIAVNLPKGTKDKIKELTGKSCNAYISELVLNDIEKLENNTSKIIENPSISIKKTTEQVEKSAIPQECQEESSESISLEELQKLIDIKRNAEMLEKNALQATESNENKIPDFMKD